MSDEAIYSCDRKDVIEFVGAGLFIDVRLLPYGSRL